LRNAFADVTKGDEQGEGYFWMIEVLPTLNAVKGDEAYLQSPRMIILKMWFFLVDLLASIGDLFINLFYLTLRWPSLSTRISSTQ